ncbi:protein kinase domain-containing protein [Streptomyces exfoliatus]|uniref:protein kinase domain-containing protein n=1 Tax=Streptomyces exfoliatus TaxID=1905 RepID=UPI00099C8F74|nr:PQQ-binding-like beta-propeller repeat protein [Streptomyces exfoliatus]
MRTPSSGGADPTAGQPPFTTVRREPDAATRPFTTVPPPSHGQVPGQASPARIGPYEVFQLLGEGGMGRVFLARSPGSRLVALKVIRPEYAETPDFRGRFRREAEAARSVSGFFTPPVLDADADAPQPWLATAYVPAPSLHEVVRGFGVLPEPALRALGTGLAEALLAIHEAGIVHRDLKPGNVLVAEDGPRVIDFGISRAADATQVTRTGTVMGTPGFMAPEQIVSSREAGPAADVFSLGCVLVFAATGQGPFGAGGTAEILYRAVHHPPRLDGVPTALGPLIDACLDKDPALRPPAASVLATLGAADPAALLTEGLRRDLARRAAHAAVLVTAPPVPVTPLAPTLAPAGAEGPSRRAFLWIAAGGTTAVAAGGAAALTAWRSRTGKEPPRSGGGTVTGAGTGSTGVAEPGIPAGPEPRWKTPVKSLDNGQLRLLGDTLVRWDSTDAIGYDTATGKQRWTGSLRPPSEVTSAPKWLGVQGSMLFAEGWSGENGYLFGVDATGRQKFAYAVTRAGADGRVPYVQSVQSVSGSIAVLAVSGDDGYGIVAVDLTSGRVLWSHRRIRGSDFQAHADGRHCFLQDNGTLRGLDLRSGTERWSVPDVIEPGAYPRLASDGTTLLVVSVKVQAFRASDGAKLWTAVNETTTLSPATVRGGRAHVFDGQDRVFALDMRIGEQAWHTASPLNLTTSGGANSHGPTVSPSVVAAATYATGDVPGFVVLRASDGKPLWAHQPSGGEAGGKSAWLLQTSGDSLFAASETTLYAFRSTTS